MKKLSNKQIHVIFLKSNNFDIDINLYIKNNKIYKFKCNIIYLNYSRKNVKDKFKKNVMIKILEIPFIDVKYNMSDIIDNIEETKNIIDDKDCYDTLNLIKDHFQNLNFRSDLEIYNM